MVSGLGGATRCRCFLVDLSGVLPIRRATVIVERGLTAHLEFDGAADAFDRTEKGVFGIPVGRCALVRVRSLVDVVPGTENQGVADDEPAGLGLPGGLENESTRQIAPSGRHVLAVGADTEMACAAVEDGTEHAGGVRAGNAHPLDRSVTGNQARGFAIGKKRIVVDRGKVASMVTRGGGRNRLHHFVVSTHSAIIRPESAHVQSTRCRDRIVRRIGCWRGSDCGLVGQLRAVDGGAPVHPAGRVGPDRRRSAVPPGGHRSGSRVGRRSRSAALRLVA